MTPAAKQVDRDEEADENEAAGPSTSIVIADLVPLVVSVISLIYAYAQNRYRFLSLHFQVFKSKLRP
ncbi:hypothetical protein K435DRAFT_36736 [Dendrothele bispora CBS 962.96]|uniref:Uncharacterized protein n=1 Tax=Dendrothele bispora (strain CBS 962.96) TaxID=1314807 RepID=A0A4S8M792_DENBC|nr:hypothetical protein K435DRAFT_36736 [Dendrothele bispora CBS 962.96]